MIEACTQVLSHSRVKVEEKGKSAVFSNAERRPLQKIRFDGCVVKNSEACDYVVLDAALGYVLVELKGRDVEKALQQIYSSVDYIKKNNLFEGRFAALIVCSGVKKTPRFTTQHQRIQNEFSKKYKAPVHIVNGVYEYTINGLLSFGSAIRN